MQSSGWGRDSASIKLTSRLEENNGEMMAGNLKKQDTVIWKGGEVKITMGSSILWLHSSANAKVIVSLCPAANTLWPHIHQDKEFEVAELLTSLQELSLCSSYTKQWLTAGWFIRWATTPLVHCCRHKRMYMYWLKAERIGLRRKQRTDAEAVWKFSRRVWHSTLGMQSPLINHIA